MNVPRIIERAMLKMLQDHADVGATTWLRTWRSLALTADNKRGTDRQFPLVDIRCAPATYDEDQATMACICQIIMATNEDSDIDHAVIVGIETAVRDCCERYYQQWRTAATGVEATTFNTELTTAADEESKTFSVTGVTFSDSLMPYDEDGHCTVGFTMVFHFGRIKLTA